MIIQRETTDALTDAIELFELDWEETVTYSNKQKLNINIDAYKKYESENRLFFFSAREEGKMIGYWGWVISASLQTQSLIANSFGLFVKKSHRGTMLWKELLDYSKKILKENNINHIRQSTSPKHDISILLERVGFEKEETTYGMFI